MTRPFVTAVRTAHSLDVIVIEVRDSDGNSGWGEAPTSWRVTGESAASVGSAISEVLARVVIGRSVEDPTSSSEAIEAAVMHNSSARMALECAIYDLAARASERSLHEYLGGAATQVATDMTLSAAVHDNEVDGLIHTAKEHIEEGFTTLKIKVGAGGDDLAALVKVRRALGRKVILRVDANQGWSPHEAVRIITALEDASVNLDMVEQPVHRDDLDGLAFVRAHVQTPLTADESVWTRRDLREVVSRHAADVINIKLAKTGGIREALALAQEARRNDIGVIVGCMAESPVGIAAAAALASVLDATSLSPARAHDLDGGRWLAASPVRGGIAYEPPYVVLDAAPGTGIVEMAPDG